jgi:AraC-like DNA-binding protein
MNKNGLSDVSGAGLRDLCKRYGGQLFIQNGQAAGPFQNPPRAYWLMCDQPRHPAPNFIKTAARIEGSWGMSVRLGKNPGYRRVIDSLSMTYILKGTGSFWSGSQRRDVAAGDLLLLFPGVPHAYGPAPGERWDEISVFFGGPVFEGWQQAGLLDPREPVHRLAPVERWEARIQQALVPLARAEAAQNAEDWGRLAGLIGAMCTAWQKPVPDPDAAWAERAKKSLRRLRTLRKVDWAALARGLGVSERSFRRRFRQVSGMTPGDYHMQHRIEEARRRLLESDEKVADIALGLDFANEFHFSRRFKQMTGVSPCAYRERHSSR